MSIQKLLPGAEDGFRQPYVPGATLDSLGMIAL